jgi:hypothetical protein
LFEHAHRLVEAHVLVDRQNFAGRLSLRCESFCSGEIERQRLLRQDGLDVLLLQRVPDQVRLLIGRKGDVDDLDVRIFNQRLWRGVDLGDSPSIGDRLGMRRRARRNRRHRKSGLLVACQMHIGHDESRADCADAKIAAPNGRVGNEFRCV